MSADLQYVIEEVFAKGARVAVRARAEGTVEAQLPLPRGITQKKAFSQGLMKELQEEDCGALARHLAAL
jgi:hypothetical protein